MTELKILEVFLHDQLIGTLANLAGDRNLFVFNQDYIDNPLRPTLSLSMKDEYGNLIREIKPTRTRLPPFFANLLPEGYLRDYLALHAQVNPEREFHLLAALGKDLPGALKIGPIIQKSEVTKTVPVLEEKAEGSIEGQLRFSLAGVQLKFSAFWENHKRLTIPVNGIGGSWIVKLPSPMFPNVPQNEYAMMELARRVGIDVPETALISLEQIKGLPKDIEHFGTHAYVIKRFDRDKDGSAIHIEDFAQVFGVYPEKKYRAANFRNIAMVIHAEMGKAGIREFICRFVFNALIGNGDMHLKNWSLIYPDQRSASLAPAYDFVSTLPYLPEDNLALNFVDSKAYVALTIDEFRRFATKSQLPEKLVVDTVLETVDRFVKAWKTRDDLPIDEKLQKAISAHLKVLPFIP